LIRNREDARERANPGKSVFRLLYSLNGRQRERQIDMKLLCSCNSPCVSRGTQKTCSAANSRPKNRNEHTSASRTRNDI
jgi:hypothetical protein